MNQYDENYKAWMKIFANTKIGTWEEWDKLKTSADEASKSISSLKPLAAKWVADYDDGISHSDWLQTTGGPSSQSFQISQGQYSHSMFLVKGEDPMKPLDYVPVWDLKGWEKPLFPTVSAELHPQPAVPIKEYHDGPLPDNITGDALIKLVGHVRDTRAGAKINLNGKSCCVCGAAAKTFKNHLNSVSMLELQAKKEAEKKKAYAAQLKAMSKPITWSKSYGEGNLYFDGSADGIEIMPW